MQKNNENFEFYLNELEKTIRKLESLGKPIVCAISGKSNLGGLKVIISLPV